MQPKKPQLPKVLDQTEVSFPEEGIRIERRFVADAQWGGCNAQRVAFDQLQLQKTGLASMDATGASMLDVQANACDLSNAILDETDIRRVEFNDCRMTGLAAGDSTFQDIAFNQCRLHMVNFRMSRFESVLFKKCDLRGADFIGAQLTRVEFRDCDLDEVTFERAVLSDVDFRSSRIANLKTALGLGGATIDSLQLLDIAPIIASAHGIKVED